MGTYNGQTWTKGDGFTNGLRAAADWFDAHPDVPRPLSTTLNVFPLDTGVPALVRQLTGFRKWDFGSWLALGRDFGDAEHRVSVEVNFERAKVCERKVVGTKEVPEKVIPAHTEEIVEWECLPLLGSADALRGTVCDETRAERPTVGDVA